MKYVSFQPLFTFFVTITSLSSPHTFSTTAVPARTGAFRQSFFTSSITGKIIFLGTGAVSRTLASGSSPPSTRTEVAMVRTGAVSS